MGMDMEMEKMKREMRVAQLLVGIGIDGLICKANLILGEDLSRLGLRIDLQKHLEHMVPRLQMLQPLLPDTEKKAETEMPVVLFLEKIVGLTSEADNLLDECAYHVGKLTVETQDKRRNKVCNFFSSSNPFMLSSKITRRMADVNWRLEYIYRCSLAFRIRGNNISGKQEENLQIQLPANVSQIFIDNADQLEQIKKILFSTESEEDLCVITIVGKQGIGKTTIAKQAYKDFAVLNHFDERMWVHVSDDFDIHSILKLMLESVSHTSSQHLNKEALQYKLLERLKRKKYLLVLDDVRNEDFSTKSDLLKDVLRKLGGLGGSKILVTTSSRAVGEMMTSDSKYLYEVTSQQPNECWNMLKKIAFAEGGAQWSPELEQIGSQIVECCSCHPLLVKLVAGVMYFERDTTEWKMMAEIMEKSRSAICDMSWINVLKRCYDHLPSLKIKQCFAYCSIFPKGSNMQREELVQLWMAQGFLIPQGEDQMEDVGTKYLNILVCRNFLQVAEEDDNDNKTLCTMPNALHDLASELSSHTIVKDQEVKDCFGTRMFRVKHLSLDNCTVKMSATLGNEFAKLVTLQLVHTGNLAELLKYSRCLRVLIVVDLLLEELPSAVAKLKHLRYLDISKTRIIRLPNSIVNLYNLQTLRLHDLEHGLPENFENLIRLRHFHVENFKDLDKLKLLPPKFQKLISPSSFKACFKACLVKEREIAMLGQLEQPERYSTVQIFRLENVKDAKEASEAKLSRMSRIDSLKLHWNARRGNNYDENVLEGLEPNSNIRNLIIENYKGSKFPSWVGGTKQLCHLVKIELEGCSCCEQIPPLGHLHCLKIVRIMGLDSVKFIGTEFYGFANLDEESSGHGRSSNRTTAFPALREFCLKGMASLEKWSEALHASSSSPREAFPSLEKLEVEQCPKLTCLPDTLINKSRKHLQRLEIALCDELIHLPKELGRLELLADLDIHGLPSIPEVSVGYLDKLRSLTIGSFFSASGDSHHTQGASASRSSLHLEGGSVHSSALPGQIQNLCNLRFLTIWGYGGLESLPEWLGKLRSLQTLKLELCGKLKYLPPSDVLKQLSDLVELNVCLCPLLEERCIRGSRPEWDKISHIPTIKMSYETIQSPN